MSMYVTKAARERGRAREARAHGEPMAMDNAEGEH